MRSKSKLFIGIVIVATAVSAFLGARAIVGATSTLRGGADPETAPGEIESTGSEAAGLLAELSPPESDERTARDPLVVYTEAPAAEPAAPVKAPRKSAPTCQVTAVFLDEDPTAVVVVNGARKIVRVGDDLAGARVTAITSGGVTVEGADGVHTYPYATSKQPGGSR